MKYIAVTGGAGRLGSKVVEELLAHDYSVLSVDCVQPAESPCRFVQVELTDADKVHQVLAGVDAVIHLAAIPGPRARPEAETFQTNSLSTYHVAMAAETHGLKKLVFASTIFTLGWHKSADRYWPQYVPVDEDHPIAPLEAYGLSKQVGEATCEMLTQRTGIPTVSLRIMNVIQQDKYDTLPWPTPTRDQGMHFGMWPYVGVDDAATACRLALEAETQGHEAMWIAAEDIRFDVPTETLLHDLAPQVEIRQPLPGRSSVISIEKARRLIGYDPEISWPNF